jgi:hypothetical protein
MNQNKRERKTLKKILWIDFLLGFVAGIVGIIFYRLLANLMNIPGDHLIVISLVTILYSVYAFYLAKQKEVSLSLVRLLINANWFWAIISLATLMHHSDSATAFGLVYLVLQILVVAALAFWEGKQLRLVTRMQQ